MINFFNYINITIDSTKENITMISDFIIKSIPKEEKSSYTQCPPSIMSNTNCDGIHIHNMTFSYDSKKVFNKFSFMFRYGNLYEIRGARGIGKSTLLKLIYNLISPSEGYILIDGVLNSTYKRIEDLIFYLPSSSKPFLIDYKDNIFLGKDISQSDLMLLKLMDIDIHNNKECKTLSTGEQLRLALARGIISNKKIFLLDEFNANLDNECTEKIIRILYEKVNSGALVIVINHKDKIPGSITLELRNESDYE